MKNLDFLKLKAFAILVLFVAFGVTSCDNDDDPPTPNQTPVALFTATPSAATVGDEISFTDNSGDPDGTIQSWDWAFGDGNTSTEQNPKHTYAEAGEFEVALTVTDNEGASTPFSMMISINAFAELWAEQVGTATISPSAPAIGDDGTLYFGSQDFNVYAVDPTNGSIKWSYATGARVRSRAAIADDGTIYVTAQDNKLYALNSNGSLKWSYETGASIFNASPAVGADGTIYFGSDDAKLYAMNADGTEKWSFETGARVRVDAAIGSDGTIYVGSDDAKLYALNTDGTEKWSYTAGAPIKASPCMDADGTIYFGDDGGIFYALNSDGTEKWKFTTVDNNPFLGGPVLGEDGTIYVGTKRGPTSDAAVFYAINANGTEQWKYTFAPSSEDPSFQSDILGTPTVGADGTVYITFNDGNLYAFRADGTIKFNYKVATDDPAERWDQAIWTSPALTEDGILYFQDYSGNVYALQVSASGLANSNWPTRGKNLKRNCR
ncbi:MAG: PQQ-binding-like beta-propeller repeat protein [Bacteroidota bacterium]